MNINEVIFTNNIPTRDFHGLTSEESIYRINEFITDAYNASYDLILIIHGHGKGIIRENIRKVCKTNQKVLDYRINYPKFGVSIIKVKKTVDKYNSK